VKNAHNQLRVQQQDSGGTAGTGSTSGTTGTTIGTFNQQGTQQC